MSESMKQYLLPGFVVLAVLLAGGVFVWLSSGPSEDDTADGCTDKVDNDTDGKVDCDDTDCKQEAQCIPENDHADGAGCSNLIDDDRDGQLDCPDPDCTGVPECESYRLGLSLETERVKLLEVNKTRTENLGSLWDDYGGGMVSAMMGEESGIRILDALKNEVKGVEKASFFEAVRRVGVGEPHGATDPKLVTYLESQETIAQGEKLIAQDREVAGLERVIEEIQGKIAAAGAAEPPAAETAVEEGSPGTP